MITLNYWKKWVKPTFLKQENLNSNGESGLILKCNFELGITFGSTTKSNPSKRFDKLKI